MAPRRRFIKHAVPFRARCRSGPSALRPQPRSGSELILSHLSINKAATLQFLLPLLQLSDIKLSWAGVLIILSASKQKIRVLVADDHPVVRKGLLTCLSSKERLRVIGEAADGDEALQKIRDLKPDVVLLDISMPKMNGLAVTELIRKELPTVKVLILSVHSNKEYIFRIIQAGAHGFVSKEAPPDEVLRAIESVVAGESFFTPEVARSALNQLINNGGKEAGFLALTAREREVLTLIAEGQSNKEIANRLNIGVRTIETHRERIMRRLNIRSVAGLTKYTIANGMVSLEQGGDAP